MKVMERIIIFIGVVIMLLSAILLIGKWEKLEGEQEEFAQMAISIKRLKRETESQAGDEKKKQAEGGTQRREILPEYQNLYEENQDFVGWIQIEGTMIDYPVMWNTIFTGIFMETILTRGLLLRKLFPILYLILLQSARQVSVWLIM